MATRFNTNWDDLRKSPMNGVRKKTAAMGFAPGQVPQTPIGGPTVDNTAGQQTTQRVVSQIAAKAAAPATPTITTAPATDGADTAVQTQGAEKAATTINDLAATAAQPAQPVATSPGGVQAVAAKAAQTDQTAIQPQRLTDAQEISQAIRSGGMSDGMAMRIADALARLGGITAAQAVSIAQAGDPQELSQILSALGLSQQDAMALTVESGQIAAQGGETLNPPQTGTVTPGRPVRPEDLSTVGPTEQPAGSITILPNEGQDGGATEAQGIDTAKIDAIWGDYFAQLNELQTADLKNRQQATGQMYEVLRRELEQTGGYGSMAARNVQGELLRGQALADAQQNVRDSYLAGYEAQADALLQKAQSYTNLAQAEAQLTESARQFDASLSLQQQSLQASINQAEAQLAESRRQFDAAQEADKAQWQQQIDYWQATLQQNQSQFDASLSFEQQQWADQLEQAKFDRSMSRFNALLTSLSVIAQSDPELAATLTVPALQQGLPEILGSDFFEDPVVVKGMAQYYLKLDAQKYIDANLSPEEIQAELYPDGNPLLTPDEIDQIVYGGEYDASGAPQVDLSNPTVPDNAVSTLTDSFGQARATLLVSYLQSVVGGWDLSTAGGRAQAADMLSGQLAQSSGVPYAKASDFVNVAVRLIDQIWPKG